MRNSFTVSGGSALTRGNHPSAGHLKVAANYFATMKTPLLAGRVFQRTETKESPLVVIVNDAFSKKYFPGKNAIGQRIIIDDDSDSPPAAEVVGVVGNSRHDSLSAPPGPEFYTPLSQDPERVMSVVIRTPATNLTGLEGAMQRAVHLLDKDLFAPKLRPMQELLSAQLAQPRFNMVLLAVFAGVAMVLAAIGIYGVIAYSVALRTREIGIRMALGAQKTQMLGMLLRQSLTLVAFGIAIGVFVALGATRVMATLLYGVDANDVSTFAAVIFLLGGAALLASYIPARRAM
jgi:putative ABC transport system permease protein